MRVFTSAPRKGNAQPMTATTSQAPAPVTSLRTDEPLQIAGAGRAGPGGNASSVPSSALDDGVLRGGY